MNRRMILYRGSLKSCNYHCSYCPFSRHPMSERELARDREQWFSFVRTLERQRRGIRALMVTPYGEALIHPWYWEGLGRLSALPEMDAVGAQTNLSFPIEEFLTRFREAGGVLGKLRLWATFHPEMTEPEVFAGRCRRLAETGVRLCAGCVGAPDHLEQFQELKSKLPPEVYLWINQMDGLNRPYTERELEAFLELDPYFMQEVLPAEADVGLCGQRLFAEGDGRLRTCNISPVLKEKWTETGEPEFPAPICRRKYCSCYLAYGGRQDWVGHMLFGPYPLFRIPRRPRAVFLDVAGTLTPGHGKKDGGKTPDRTLAALKALAGEGTALFFATTLPYREAMERCRQIRSLFRGGVFAGGAHLLLREPGGIEGKPLQEHFEFLDRFCGSYLEDLKSLERQFGFRLMTCRRGDLCYKITLLRPARRPWENREAEAVFDCLRDKEKESGGAGRSGLSGPGDVRYLIEENCLQILPAQADKAGGVKTLCRWMGIRPSEAFAFGDSPEDREMTALCGE